MSFSLETHRYGQHYQNLEALVSNAYIPAEATRVYRPT